jgi:L-rhamnose mutarotase
MKEKIASLFLKISIPMAIFCMIGIRCAIFGATWGDAIALLAVSGLYGYSLFLNKDRNLMYQQISKDISELKNAVTGLKVNSTVKKTYESGQEKEKVKRYF